MKLIFGMFLWIFIFPNNTYSHPHVFFDAFFRVNITNNNLENISVIIFLDEMNSLLEKEMGENSTLQKEILSHFHFSLNGEEQKQNLTVKKAEFEDDILIMHLEYQVKKTIKKGDKLVFSLYDPEYYYTYEYEERRFGKNIENSSLNLDFSLNENENKAFYFESIHPFEYEVTIQ